MTERITAEQAREALVRLMLPQVGEDAPSLWYWIDNGGILAHGDVSILALFARQCLASPRGVSVEKVEGWATGMHESFNGGYFETGAISLIINDMRRAIEAAKKGHDHA